MKKIINGKMYNTETAKFLGSWSSSCSVTDFNYSEEELYLKKTGEYFLYGSGGPMTKYAERCQDGWSGGSDIVPLNGIAEARAWAETHLETDEYVSIFGEPEE